uniref:Leukotriene A-4 hydrolase homolog n=1 Tax=Panagrellus redivivus TaxID=6233 RepID=A0A7E4VXP7_PANRE
MHRKGPYCAVPLISRQLTWSSKWLLLLFARVVGVRVFPRENSRSDWLGQPCSRRQTREDVTAHCRRRYVSFASLVPAFWSGKPGTRTMTRLWFDQVCTYLYTPDLIESLTKCGGEQQCQATRVCDLSCRPSEKATDGRRVKTVITTLAVIMSHDGVLVLHLGHESPGLTQCRTPVDDRRVKTAITTLAVVTSHARVLISHFGHESPGLAQSRAGGLIDRVQHLTWFQNVVELLRPVFTRYLPKPVVVIADYDLIKHVLANQEDRIVKTKRGFYFQDSHIELGAVAQEAVFHTDPTLKQSNNLKTYIDNCVSGIVKDMLFEWNSTDYEFTDNGHASNKKNFTKFLKNEISRRKDDFDATATPQNFVDAFLMDCNNAPFENKDEVLMQNCTEMWTSACDVTSALLRWGILYLVRHPDVQNKIHCEIDTYCDVRAVTTSDSKILHYTRAFFEEVNRITDLTPDGTPYEYQAQCDFDVDGQTIKQGSTVVLQVGAAHLDGACFVNAEKLLPERFLTNGYYDGAKMLIHNKDRTLGQLTGRMMFFLIFSALIQNFSFEVAKETVPPLDREAGEICEPKPFFCRIRQRRGFLITKGKTKHA